MSHQQGRGGMGSHKHGISGHATKSPKLKHWLKREVEGWDKKIKRKTKMFGSVRDLIKKGRG